MTIKKHIPNAITCCNLICGCIAIIQCFQGNLISASYLVGLALIFDFFDGFAARMLNVSSPIGKDLDSLADMVTFGVVPGVMLYKIILLTNLTRVALGADASDFIGTGSENTSYFPAYFALIIPLFSAIRLAKFNNDVRQSDSFIGLPTPANAMVICSLPLIFKMDQFFLSKEFTPVALLILNPWLLCLLSFIMSLLLISELPLFALKFKNFSWVNNKLRFTFIGLAILLAILLKYAAIPLIILLYILLSIVNNIFSNKRV
jgi:CDP-diacylglycerol---serine O-phosphatidyltransferase